MTGYLVDVTIPVHSSSRPIARAVSSIVDHTRARVRVNVVAHNIDPRVIRSNLGAYASHPSVRLLELDDAIHSPAGPMNHGLDRSDAPFIAVMGSDDELEPGALDSWLALQHQTGASMVIARVDVLGRGVDPYPPVRNGRRSRSLSARKDRLAYRSAPLGLIDRRRFGDLRFTAGLSSGEDLAYSTTLWFAGAGIAYDRTGPAYLVHQDADDRVTFTTRTVADDFAFLDAIEALPWFTALGHGDRIALAVKILRIHLFDSIRARIAPPERILPHRSDLVAVVDRLEAMAPGVLRLLSRADREVIDALRSDHADPERLLALLDARWNYRSLGALVPRNPFLVLHRQAPVRTLAAGVRATTQHSRAS